MDQNTSELNQQANPPSMQNVKRNVLVTNILIGSFITIGNIVLPCFFWGVGTSASFWALPPLFLSGVLLSEIGVIGTYAAFSNDFYVVRWAWSLIAAFLCALFLYIGIDIAEGSSRMKAEMSLVVTAMALAGNLVVCGVASLVSWITGFRFVEARNSNVSKPSKSFELVFLFRFMIAIALIMFLLRFFPALRINANSRIRNALPVLFIFTLHLPLCLALIASSLAATMTIEFRKLGLGALLISFLAATPLLVATSRMATGSGTPFWFECGLTVVFYLGFVSSLLVVFRLWRFAGLRLSR